VRLPLPAQVKKPQSLPQRHISARLAQMRLSLHAQQIHYLPIHWCRLLVIS
jgi:hypothetical protein